MKKNVIDLQSFDLTSFFSFREKFIEVFYKDKFKTTFKGEKETLYNRIESQVRQFENSVISCYLNEKLIKDFKDFQIKDGVGVCKSTNEIFYEINQVDEFGKNQLKQIYMNVKLKIKDESVLKYKHIDIRFEKSKKKDWYSFRLDTNTDIDTFYKLVKKVYQGLNK